MNGLKMNFSFMLRSTTRRHTLALSDWLSLIGALWLALTAALSLMHNWNWRGQKYVARTEQTHFQMYWSTLDPPDRRQLHLILHLRLKTFSHFPLMIETLNNSWSSLQFQLEVGNADTWFECFLSERLYVYTNCFWNKSPAALMRRWQTDHILLAMCCFNIQTSSV